MPNRRRVLSHLRLLAAPVALMAVAAPPASSASTIEISVFALEPDRSRRAARTARPGTLAVVASAPLGSISDFGVTSKLIVWQDGGGLHAAPIADVTGT